MKCKVIIFLPILITYCIFNSCSSEKETQKIKKQQDSLYIFDEVPPEDIFKFETPAQKSLDYYVVQIGAYSSLERAKEFADISRAILGKDIKVEFNQAKSLYVVWIHPPFENKVLAENYRKELKNYEEYKDAWIVKITSQK
jgi:cell division protein FtsN